MADDKHSSRSYEKQVLSCRCNSDRPDVENEHDQNHHVDEARSSAIPPNCSTEVKVTHLGVEDIDQMAPTTPVPRKYAEEARSGVDLPDCFAGLKVRHAGFENTDEMAPTTPVLRTATKPPKARRAAAVVPVWQEATCPATTTARPDGSGKLGPKRKLQKLGRIRASDFDITLLDATMTSMAKLKR